MEQNFIIINPVSNGFVVSLPMTYKSMNNPDDFVAALAKVSKLSDPILNPENEKKKDDLTKQENVFVFDSMESVLSFLANKYL